MLFGKSLLTFCPAEFLRFFHDLQFPAKFLSLLVHDRVTLLELCLLILVRFRRNHAQKHSNDQHRSCTRVLFMDQPDPF
jgi:hypothetical protein